MIGHLQALIAQARKEIEQLKLKIEEAKKELEICKQLKPILTRIGENASNGYYSLQSAGNSLNSGIKISGVGQGNKILERAAKISDLNSKAKVGEGNVQKRIIELEKNILEWTNKIAELEASIAGWQAEIARLEELARQVEEAKRTVKRTTK